MRVKMTDSENDWSEMAPMHPKCTNKTVGEPVELQWPQDNQNSVHHRIKEKHWRCGESFACNPERGEYPSTV